MMLAKKTKDLFSRYGEIIIISVLMFAFLMTTTPEIGPDSVTYLTFDPMRPPLYPLFLWLFRGFGQYQLTAAMWAQALIALSVFVYARNWLIKNLNISRAFTFIILLFTTVVMYFHYKILQMPLSEALAFPLFIIVFTLIVECFYNLKIKKIIYLALFANLLILTRAQFYYLYPLMLLLLPWYAWKKIGFKKIFLVGGIILASILLTLTVNRGYHYFQNGHFADIPVVGEDLIVQALYLSDAQTADSIKDPAQRALFEKIITSLEKQQVTLKSSPPIFNPPTYLIANAYYPTAYNAILGTIIETMKTMPSYEQSHTLIRLSKTLYLQNIKENLVLYFWRINSFFGDLVFFSAFLTLFAVVCFYSAWRNTQQNIKMVFVLIALLTILVNTAFVAIFEPLLPIYSFYSYFLIYCLCGILASETRQYFEDTSWKLSSL